MNNGNDSVFTPTQQAIVQVLRDGEPHKTEEILQAVDPQMKYKVLKEHFAGIRLRIRPHGYDLICQFIQRQRQWRIIRTVRQPTAPTGFV